MKKLLAAGLVLLPLLASCSVAPPTTEPSPSASADATASPTASPTSATPTPETTPTPTPTPTPAPTPTLGYRYWKDPDPPEPLPTLTAEQQEKWGACLDKTLTSGSKGPCVSLVTQELKDLGLLPGTPGSTMTVAAANTVLRYQRSRNIKPTATVSEQTWYALASGKPARPETLPEECKLPGVVLCVDQGHDTLRYVKDGEVLRTVKVRTGGFTTEPKTGKWRVHPTVNGLYKVYRKSVSPPSENYGDGAMPYSIMFDPNMYVHYSTPFARQGYTSSSHGCVNVAGLADIKWLYSNTPVGSYVYVF